MGLDGTRIARQVAQAIRRNGTAISLRLPAGAAPLQNPPILEAPTIAAAAAAGDTTISIAAKLATGLLAVGDTIKIGSMTCRVAAQASATQPPYSQGTPPGFVAVQLAAPLSRPVAAGTPVLMAYAADQTIWAKISSFSLSVVGNGTIEMRDLRVVVAAYGVPEITPAHKLLIDGELRSVVNVVPIYAGGTVARQEVQAR